MSFSYTDVSSTGRLANETTKVGEHMPALELPPRHDVLL